MSWFVHNLNISTLLSARCKGTRVHSTLQLKKKKKKDSNWSLIDFVNVKAYMVKIYIMKMCVTDWLHAWCTELKALDTNFVFHSYSKQIFHII